MKIALRFSQPHIGTIIKNYEGKLVTNEFRVTEIWRSYFDELLNRQSGFLVQKLLLEEMTKSFLKLENNKVPVNDIIRVECLKNCL